MGCASVGIRVLGIATEPPGLPSLNWPGEISTWAQIEGVDVEVLAGPDATMNAAANKISRGPWDIIALIGHSKANRFRFSDGRDVSGEWLATILKRAQPECCLILACYSDCRDDGLNSIGESVANAGTPCITGATAVDDGASAVYSTEFVRAMAACLDIGRADRVASEMAAQFNLDTAKAVRLHRPNLNGTRLLFRRMDAIECKLDEVSGRLRSLEEKVA